MNAKELHCRDRIIDFSTGPVIMGIINVTPDSFSDGGRTDHLSDAIRMLEEGATILDIGGESTRPGAIPITADEEWARIGPVLHAIAHAKLDVILSVDTSKAEVASKALKAGVHIVNDITALADPDMLQAVGEHHAGIVLMHMRGTPQAMQTGEIYYENVLEEVRDFLVTRAEYFMACGGKKNQIVLDPGIGFGKTTAHNIELSKHLDVFVQTGFPVLYGPSRKRFLGEITGRKNPDERDIATATACAFAATSGVQIMRVHNVKATQDAMRVGLLLTKQAP